MKRLHQWLGDLLLIAVAAGLFIVAESYLAGRANTIQFHGLFLVGCFVLVAGVNAMIAWLR